MKIREVSHATVLGIGEDIFILKKGDLIEELETNVYGRVSIVFHGGVLPSKASISKSMLERISNKMLGETIIMGEEKFVGKIPERGEEKVVHYAYTKGTAWADIACGIPEPLCGDQSEVVLITSDLAKITCEKCLSEFPY